MLDYLIRISLKNRLLVCVLAVALVALGGRSLMNLPVDAFPDTTPVQVQINTAVPALNPEEAERQITIPIELAISGLPGLQNVRSVSKFGLSQVVATFEDRTSIYLARQLITERLQSVELPEDIARPELGPISTGLGEVFHYIVRTSDPQRSLASLREINDWVIKPQLRKVPGVAEVNTWGGFEKQFHVVVETDRLIKLPNIHTRRSKLGDEIAILAEKSDTLVPGICHVQTPGAIKFDIARTPETVGFIRLAEETPHLDELPIG